MQRRFVSLILAIAVFISIMPIHIISAGPNPSNWAISEIESAKKNGLVVDSMLVDYSRYVTREEFCQLVVKLYEKITNTSAVPSPNIFVDTDNVEVLKAYNVGIVRGISATKFAPNLYISRQEICAMMTRCIEKAIPTSTVYSYSIHNFTDAKHIGSWAIPYVNYSYEHNVIAGVDNNCILPLGNVTCEGAIALVNRMYENRDTFIGETKETKGTVDISSKSKGAIQKVDIVCRSPYDLGNISVTDVSVDDPFVASTAGSTGQVINISGTSGNNLIKDVDVVLDYNKESLNISEDNIGVARYDKDLQRMVLLPNTVVLKSKNQIKFYDEKIGEYTIVDKNKWYDEWTQTQAVARNSKSVDKNDDKAYYDVVFLVDDSGSMVDNDPDKVRATAVYNFVRTLTASDGIALEYFTDGIRTGIDYQKVSDITDWKEFQKTISRLNSNGGTDISGAIQKGISILDGIDRNTQKMMVLLTDGKQDTKGEAYDENIAKNAAAKGYIINVVSLGSDTDEEVLSQIANVTGGKYYTSETADSLVGVYKNVQLDNIGWSDESNDGDKLPDAIESKGMRNQYGIFIKSNPSISDTDGDSLSDDKEMGELVIDSTNVTAQDVLNGVTSYVYYIMKSDPNFVDSDNDGITDDKDKFPLIKDTISWTDSSDNQAEEPVNEDTSTDTNNDGISDYYTQMIYEGKIKTTQGTSFNGYNFGGDADYDGDGIPNGKELVITENNGKIYLQMLSDPTKINSDGDMYTDADEIKYGTDPLVVDLLNSEVQLATDSDMYVASQYRDSFYESKVIQGAVFTNNFLLGSNYDQVAVYKEILMQYFSEINNNYKQDLQLKIEANFLNEVLSDVKKALKASEIDDYYNAPEKIKELEKYSDKLKNLEKLAYQANDMNELDRLTKELIDVYDEINNNKNIINKTTREVVIYKPSVLESSEDLFGAVEIGADLVDIMYKWSEFSANAEIINQNIYVLEILEGSNDPIMAAAAKEVRAAAESELNRVLVPLKDVIVGKTIDFTSEQIVTQLATVTESSAAMWIVLAKNIADAISGVSENGKNAIQTIVAAEAADLLAKDLHSKLDKETKLFNAANKTALEAYTNLLLLRKVGEEKYKDVVDLNFTSEVISNILGKKQTKEEAKRTCDSNIQRLNEFIDKYSYTNIENRKH